MNRGRITSALLSLFNDFLPFQTGDGEAPLAPDGGFIEPETGYGMLHSIPGTMWQDDDSWSADRAQFGWVRYQMTTVGITREQVENGASLAAELIFARSGGDWTHMIVPTGHSVIDRRPGVEVPLTLEGVWAGGIDFELLVQAD